MPPRTKPEVSILVPAQNEAGNISILLPEIARCMENYTYEIIVVDDASTDATAQEVQSLKSAIPTLRLLQHNTAGGKSAALFTAAQAARYSLCLMLDGDGQNDPHYLPAMLQPLLDDPAIGLVAGQRLKRGKDGILKRYASKVANAVRSRILGDNTRDTACGLKAVRRDVFLHFTYFETMHRFLPALTSAAGWKVAHINVIDRPRQHGVSKYGIWDRLAVGLPDLFGVWWLLRRQQRWHEVNAKEF